MNSRKEHLLSIRPIINYKVEAISEIEKFQNTTLRPILKFQNELLIAIFKAYIKRYKNAFYELPIEGKMNYIDNAVQKDAKFRNSLKGLVTGMFTLDEYQYYSENSSEISKRMMQMISERLKDQLQLFEN
ncbi:glyoxalase [Aureibaculum algae]|uniref:Glyoxalase n=1 Tax=Aureibaculum algae TaxID=2584122 RepID=A0A5B7TP72_9FLAO|nr:glyoxalase [Aureibaculum algae]QCX38525.1 glyoxalase [Aureibaculum algae]